MNKEKNMKLAILSGTFDPIHKSHISLAEYVYNKFEYDKILIIPAHKPPLKNNSAKAEHRYKMTELAAKNHSFLEVSDIEFQNNGKSYTILTLKELYKKYQPKGKIGFIIGTDAYINLPKWYCTEELKDLAEFILFERDIPFSDERIKKLQNDGYKITTTQLPFKDISSTEIRKKVYNNENISEYVTKEVEEYIKKYELYKD